MCIWSKTEREKKWAEECAGPHLTASNAMSTWTLIKFVGLEAVGILLAAGALVYLAPGALPRSFLNETAAAVKAELKKNKWHLGALFLIFLSGVVARIVHLFQPMRYDEAWTYTYYASKSLIRGLSDYSLPNNHLFHTLLVKISVELFGNSPWAIRLPALTAGILLIPAVYLLTRKIANPNAGLLAAAGVASSAPLILYSTNARGYSMIGLLTLLIFFFVVSLAEDLENGWIWIVLSVLAALGLWVAPVMVFPLAAAFFWFVWICPNILKQNWRRLLGNTGAGLVLTGALTLMLYTPPIVRSGLSAIIANRFVTPESLSDLVRGLPEYLFDLWYKWTGGLPGWAVFVILAGWVVAFFSYRGEAKRVLKLALAAIGAAALLILLTRLMPPARVLLYLIPIVWMVAAVGLERLMTWATVRTHINRQVVVSFAAVALTVVLAYNVISSQAVFLAYDTGTLRDARELAAFIIREKRPEDYIVVNGSSGAPLVYYADRMGVPLKSFYGKQNAGGRLLVVVNRDYRQTLESVLTARSDVTPDCSTPPKILYRLPTAFLIEVQQAKNTREQPDLKACAIAQD